MQMSMQVGKTSEQQAVQQETSVEIQGSTIATTVNGMQKGEVSEEWW
jgi:hypothetical protein